MENQTKNETAARAAFKVPNINFIGNRKIAFLISAALIAISTIALVARGGLNFSVDFVGGTELQVYFEEDVRQYVPVIRQKVSALGLGTPEVKLIRATGEQVGTEMQITVKTQNEGANNNVRDQITAALSEGLQGKEFNVLRVETVGPRVGRELQADALRAIFFSILVILGYLAIRFKYPYGIASVVALAHDAFITIGLFAVTGWEFSIPVLAAVLTVVAYSINSSIVIFDRVRENLGNQAFAKIGFEDLVNKSINETLTRNIVTTASTLIMVLAIFFVFLGTGNVLENFAAALIFGFILGTFSSLYIACAILVLWNKKWAIR